LESLKLVKEWGIWLVTIQTAAIAAVGALIADPKLPLTLPQSVLACFAVALFTISIICTSFLLVSLPGFYARNARYIYADDFGHQKPAFTRFSINLNNSIVGEHLFFVLGIIVFSVFIAVRVQGGTMGTGCLFLSQT
jgi:hypothetical protein